MQQLDVAADVTAGCVFSDYDATYDYEYDLNYDTCKSSSIFCIRSLGKSDLNVSSVFDGQILPLILFCHPGDDTADLESFGKPLESTEPVWSCLWFLSLGTTWTVPHPNVLCLQIRYPDSAPPGSSPLRVRN